jgi:hypothetical protein
MVREAVEVENTLQAANVRTYTVESCIAIAKGALLALVLDNTASGSNATSSGAAFAGIALSEKTTTDGITTIACDTGGVWDLTASEAIVIGHKVCLAGGANYICDATNFVAGNLASGAMIIGTALESATAAEVIRVDLNRK